MKNLLIILVSLLAISCSNVFNVATQKYGKVSIHLPRNLNKSLSNGDAANVANVYKVYIYSAESGQYYSIDASIIESTTVNVPIGKYNVLALAGYQAAGTPSLIGSGITRDINVIESQTTEVSIALDALDVEIQCPTEVTVNSKIEISTIFTNTCNGVLSFQSPVSYSYINLNGDPQGDSNISYTNSVNGDIRTLIGTIESPAFPTEATVVLDSGSIGLYDGSFNIAIVPNWHLYNCNTFSSLTEELTKKIKISTENNTPGLGIIISWNP